MMGIYQGLVAKLFSAAPPQPGHAFLLNLLPASAKHFPARRRILQAFKVLTFSFCPGS